ncbi:MAG: hypothetical protein WC599_13515 [Bacteroidales bacterium]
MSYLDSSQAFIKGRLDSVETYPNRNIFRGTIKNNTNNDLLINNCISICNGSYSQIFIFISNNDSLELLNIDCSVDFDKTPEDCFVSLFKNKDYSFQFDLFTADSRLKEISEKRKIENVYIFLQLVYKLKIAEDYKKRIIYIGKTKYYSKDEIFNKYMKK